MTCYSPQTAYRSAKINVKTGKYPVMFVKTQTNNEPGTFPLPCGQCLGCRLDKSKAWAIRCMHEIQTSPNPSCFITLTYDPKFLPMDGQLVKRDLQLFIKRLRFNTKAKIRYYSCGEYGEKFSRPHFHAILFGYDPPDKHFHKEVKGLPTWTSEIISKAWQDQGHALVGTATFESAAYIARYILKKQNGEAAHAHYANEDGIKLNPEFTTMSLKPGIGSDYYDLYKQEMHTTDSVILKSKEMPLPKYYDNKYEESNPEEYWLAKQLRQLKLKQHAKDLTPARLKVRLQVQQARSRKLLRTFETP
nr:MAG: replication initiation protein [Microvirus sp.]